MSAPKRVQMTRNKPWRAEHPDAVIVDRRTKWGNPFKVGTAAIHLGRGAYSPTDVGWAHRLNLGIVHHPLAEVIDASAAVEMYSGWLARRFMLVDDTLMSSDDAVRCELAGRDLACWCKPGDPCHADVLLELANPTDQENP